MRDFTTPHDHEISDLLIDIFDGDVDRIQAWLESPNLYLDNIQPAVWWRDGKARQLLEYLQQVAADIRTGAYPGFRPKRL